MNPQLLSLLIFLSVLAVLMVITVCLHRYLKLPSEQSRKFLHVAGGLMCLFFPAFFLSHWWVLALSAIAFLILLVTYMRKWMPAVHQTKRYSLGSVLFPIPVYACFLMAELNNNWLYFYLPISLLAISDTAAETGGVRWGAMSIQFFNGQKTLVGSLCFFISSIFVCVGWLYLGFHLPVKDVLLLTLLITAATTLAELVTLHGWDNLTVPAATLVILYLLG
jgi:phytol kinase